MGIFLAWGQRFIRGGAGCSAAVFLWMVVGGGGVAASPVARKVVQVRHFTAPGHTRIVLDMSAPGSFEVRRVRHPDRLAINVSGARVATTDPLTISDGLVRGVRFNSSAARAQIVIDLEQTARFRSFSLPAAAGRYDRIVVDVLRPESPGNRESGPVLVPEPAAPPFTVIIDPGHGGMDPGAMREGLAEKTVVLDIAREMARLLNTLPGYRARLTRTGDYGLELWQRVDLARQEQGDLFLSIHCNTHAKPSVDGMEVYFLSLQGATDREAGELADAENAAQLVGLDPLGAHNELVMGILMDLKMTQVLKESARLSNHLLDAGRASGVVHGRKVKQAGFRVLKSLAMPSALVEVAYMSNRENLAVLASRSGRLELANALVQGVVSWRQDEPALLQLAGAAGGAWTERYRVRRGDSLWGVARRHGTTVAEISRRNNLHGGAINVGQLLRVPGTVRQP